MALKNDILEKALHRKKSSPEAKNTHYSHFKIYELPGKEISISTEDKVETNQGQTEDKVGSNSRQTRDKLGTNWGQSRVQTRDNKTLKPETNQRQTEDKVESSSTVFSLLGNERKIIFFIFQHCKNNRQRYTEPLTIEHITLSCEINTFSTKKSIQRLEKKGLLGRHSFKNGRGGWTQYELPDHVYQNLLHEESRDKLKTKWGQTGDKVESKLETKPETNLLSSNNNINNITTTLPDEWSEIDIKPYSLFGFGKTQLKQLASLNTISVRCVEESLHEFLYDFENKLLRPSMAKSPLNNLMGLLRKGNEYVSEQYRKEFQVELKLQADRATRRKQEELKNKVILWAETLSKAEIHTFLSPSRIIDYDIYGYSDSVVGELIEHYIKIASRDLGK
jgi:predicted transcriptional regulator